MAWVFEVRQHVFGGEAKLFRSRICKSLGIGNIGLLRVIDVGDQIAILPDRHAVLAPIESERPAWQAFAGIPLALPVMQQPAGRKAAAQAPDQLIGKAAFGWS